jgi:hypothetical protein
MTVSLNKQVSCKRGTRYKMIDNKFQLQVVENQVFNTDLAGVVQSTSTRPLFQAQDLFRQRSSGHGWGAVWDCEMVSVNKC